MPGVFWLQVSKKTVIFSRCMSILFTPLFIHQGTQNLICQFLHSSFCTSGYLNQTPSPRGCWSHLFCTFKDMHSNPGRPDTAGFSNILIDNSFKSFYTKMRHNRGQEWSKILIVSFSWKQGFRCIKENYLSGWLISKIQFSSFTKYNLIVLSFFSSQVCPQVLSVSSRYIFSTISKLTAHLPLGIQTYLLTKPATLFKHISNAAYFL